MKGVRFKVLVEGLMCGSKSEELMKGRLGRLMSGERKGWDVEKVVRGMWGGGVWWRMDGKSGRV